jgi:hypothetical protein
MAAVKPDLEAIRSAMEKAEEEDEFWRRHWAEMLDKYRDQFVAVFGGEIVAHAFNLRDLLWMISEAGLSPTGVSARFITDNPRHMLR